MENKKLTFSRAVAPITFIFFVLLVIIAFSENIIYFKKSLDKIFTVEQAPKAISIDYNTLSIITKKINISEDNIPLLKKEQP